MASIPLIDLMYRIVLPRMAPFATPLLQSKENHACR